jgi:hypothetical protein
MPVTARPGQCRLSTASPRHIVMFPFIDHIRAEQERVILREERQDTRLRAEEAILNRSSRQQPRTCRDEDNTSQASDQASRGSDLL